MSSPNQNNTVTDLENKNPTLDEKFLITLLDFINVCIDVLKRIEKQGIQLKFGPSLVEMAYDYVKIQKPTVIIEKFIIRSHDNWTICSKKEKDQLMPNIKSLFAGIKEEYVSSMMEIFTMTHQGKPVVTEDDEVTMWEYIFLFIEFGLCYIHQQREWQLTESNNNEYNLSYGKEFHPEVNIKILSNLFSINLNYSSHLKDKFSSKLSNFIDDSISITREIEKRGIKLEVSSSMLEMSSGYIKNKDSRLLIHSFIEKSHKSWLTSKNRQRDELVSNIRYLFSTIEEHYVDGLVKIFSISHQNKYVVSHDNEQRLWKHIDDLIKISVLYVHEERYWVMLSPDKKKNEYRPGYSREYHSDIKLKSLASSLGIKLNYSTELDSEVENLNQELSNLNVNNSNN